MPCKEAKEDSKLLVLADAHSERNFGLRVYERYTIPLQLEGNFWLQFGLYEAHLGWTDEAIEKLQKSFEAFPDNPFTNHALASLQLKKAHHRPVYDALTRRLIRDAVAILERMAARPPFQFDHYPLVTLAKQHIGTLWKHGQVEDARRYARDYYDRTRELDRIVNSADVTGALALLLKFLTSGEWPSSALDVPLT